MSTMQPNDVGNGSTSTNTPSVPPVRPRLWSTTQVVAASIVALFALFVVVVLIVAAFGKITTKKKTQDRPEITQLYKPVDFGGTSVVKDTTYSYILQTPYFQTVPTQFKAGDLVEIVPSGRYGFDRWYRGDGDGDTIDLPGGFDKTPEDRGGIKKLDEFPLKTAPSGGLLCGFGTVVYNEDHVPHLEGTQLIFCGMGAVVRVPDIPNPKLQLTLNERWMQTSWSDNRGRIYAKLIVHRKS